MSFVAKIDIGTYKMLNTKSLRQAKLGSNQKFIIVKSKLFMCRYIHSVLERGFVFEAMNILRFLKGKS